MLSTQEKLKLAKEAGNDRKEWESMFGYYVALDDKDRLIAYGKDKIDVINKADFFNACSNNAGFRFYQIFDTYKKELIKCLLDYSW
jgi:hypothetical protein